MGIPKLYGFIQKRHGRHILSRLVRKVRIYKKTDRTASSTEARGTIDTNASTIEEKEVKLRIGGLYIDGNSLLHEAAQYVYGYGKYTKSQVDVPSWAAVGRRFIELVEEGMETTKPKEGLCIAIDGTAPVAKNQQQRTRRYLSESVATDDAAPDIDDDGQGQEDSTLGIGTSTVSVLDTSAEEGSSEEESHSSESSRESMESSIETFSRNYISPGTPFMDAVDIVIRAWLVENVKTLPKNTSYYSHRVPGEGEHKLFEAMLNSSKPKGHGLSVKAGQTQERRSDLFNVIYANDNDLILLSMLRAPQVLMMRETLDKDSKDRFVFIDIDGVKEDLKRMHHISPADFSMLVMLVGNDFIPPSPGAYAVYPTLDMALELYKLIREQMSKRVSAVTGKIEEFVLYSSTIHWDNLYRLILQLGKNESTLLLARYGEELDKPWKTGYLADTVFMRDSKARIDMDKFGDAYYDRALKSVRSEDIGIAVLDMVDAYMEGLVWTMTYLVSGISNVNVEWFYRYHYAPLLGDTSEVLKELTVGGRIDGSRWTRGTTQSRGKLFNPLEQLIATLPIGSLNSVLYETEDISQELADKVLWPLIDLFPESIDIDAEGHKPYDTDKISSKAIVMLPFIDPSRIREAARTIKRPEITRTEKLPLTSPFTSKIRERKKKEVPQPDSDSESGQEEE